jgi:hypothetical protein
MVARIQADLIPKLTKISLQSHLYKMLYTFIKIANVWIFDMS